jgi:HK97 family phage portal protein
MGFVDRFMAAVSVAGVQPSNPPDWMLRMFGGPGSSAGVSITEHNALTVADVYKCVTVIREAGAMMPWELRQRIDPRGSKAARQHTLYPILHDQPNDMMTSFSYREAQFTHLLLWGRHATYIERNPATGRIVNLWPIRPDRFRYQIKEGTRWWYVTSDAGVETQFFDDEIWYIPAYTSNGYDGISPIRLHCEALGLAKATEVYGAKFFGNNSLPSGYLSHPASIKKETAERLKKAWEAVHQGLNNAHRIAVLEEGLKFEALTIPNDEAQFLETRKFQRTEIAGFYRVPPHKIGDLEDATFSNIENLNLQFYNDAVAPWVIRIEQSADSCLLLPSEKKKFFTRFNMKAFMRGDTAARTEFYKSMFDRGVYSADDILDTEDEDLIGGQLGSRRYIAMNMVPTDLVDDVLAPAPAPQPPPKPGADPQQPPPADPAKPDPANAVRKACLRFFRDATGRVVNRKPAERKSYAETAFLQPVLAVIECILGQISPELEQFAANFCAEISRDTASWSADQAETIAAAQLENTMSAVLKRGKEQ